MIHMSLVSGIVIFLSPLKRKKKKKIKKQELQDDEMVFGCFFKETALCFKKT